MVRIAIVDDEKKEQNILLSYFARLAEDTGEQLSYSVFDSGDDLLEDYAGGFDLICLDIEMPGSDGIQTARQIRKVDQDVVLIFVTNLAQLAIRGYEVHALDFLVKPVQYYAFALKMRGILQTLSSRKERKIAIRLSGGMAIFSTDDLLYVEVRSHYLYYHTKNGIYQQKAPMKELEEKLKDMHFVRCNQCYLVNLRYVRAVDRDNVKVGEEWLKISRSRKNGFMKEIADYLGGM